MESVLSPDYKVLTSVINSLIISSNLKGLEWGEELSIHERVFVAALGNISGVSHQSDNELAEILDLC